MTVGPDFPELLEDERPCFEPLAGDLVLPEELDEPPPLLATLLCPPPLTVITCGDAAARFFELPAPFSPISTPTPMARSSVATPATRVVPGLNRECAGGGGAGEMICGSAAGSGAAEEEANRGLPRRSPQTTQ